MAGKVPTVMFVLYILYESSNVTIIPYTNK